MSNSIELACAFCKKYMGIIEKGELRKKASVVCEECMNPYNFMSKGAGVKEFNEVMDMFKQGGLNIKGKA